MASSTAIAARPSLTSLVEGATRERVLGLVLAVAGAGVGFSLGLDLRSLSPLAAADKLYLLCLALVAPLPIAALAALYHAPIHRTLLPWPVSARAHFGLGARMLLWRQWPWGAAAAAAGLGAGWGREPSAMVALIALPCALALAAQLASLGAAGLCALLADAEGPTLTKLRVGMAGPFASPRHAPFFYLPALAFGVVAFSGLLSMVGAVELATSETPSARALGLLGVAPAVGALVALIGFVGYARCGLRTIARVHEEARTIYGGRPAPAEPPYGAWIVQLLPRLVAPYAGKELREQSRSHRALWAVVTLWMLVCGVYTINVGAALPAAPLVAALVMIYLTTLPLRRAPRVGGADYLVTLPLRLRAAWFGRWVALSWPTSHAVAAAALALGLRHDTRAALALVTLALATSLAATALTSPRVAGRRGRGTGWGPAAQLVPALAVAAALAGQRSWELGMALTGALALLGLGAGLLAGGRR
jgi:hypothetical protein